MAAFRSGNGAVWLDLLTTLDGRYDGAARDLIDASAALDDWLIENGLFLEGPVTADDVMLFGATRDALHRTTVHLMNDARPETDDVEAIRAALIADHGARLDDEPIGLRLRQPESAAEALAWIVRDAIQDLNGPRHAQLRRCGDETCGGIFLDPTGRRRWCTDQSCGNRLRVRAHRARAQSGATATPG